ncbi:hypothetical protein BH23PLA1_BH23PLA1_00250 [soil metagenome]
MMLGGPVFHFELVRIARQRRFFLLRFGLGLILLLVMGYNFLFGRYWLGGRASGTLSPTEMAQFGLQIASTLLLAQGMLVLGLTPALVAGTIAEERQRKTLHYLLASRLSGVEIVLGKLGARMIHLAAFLALVLPILSLLTLIGGIDPWMLVLGYSAMATTAYFVAGLSILVSVWRPKVREAVSGAYTLMLAWLVLPPMLSGLTWVVAGPLSPLYLALAKVHEWVAASSPVTVLFNSPALFTGGPLAAPDELYRMMGLQLLGGSIFAAMAAWRLRPAFRTIEGRVPWRHLRWSPPRLRSRPEISENPVFWREAHFARAVGLPRLLGVVGVAIAGLCLLGGTAYFAGSVIGEMLGFGTEFFSLKGAREAFNIYLRIALTLVFIVWMLWVGNTTASGIVGEREQDTWTSLLATPLDGREILLGKMLGPLRKTAWIGGVIVGHWALGVLLWSVHPLAFLLCLAELALFVWFVVALGTYASIKSSSTWKAQTLTLGVLVGLHVCCMNPIPSAAFIMGVSLMSPSEVNGLLSGATSWDMSIIGLFYGGWFAFGLMLYGVAAFFLNRSSFREFDRLAGRPIRSAGPSMRPPKPKGKAGLAADDVFLDP